MNTTTATSAINTHHLASQALLEQIITVAHDVPEHSQEEWSRTLANLASAWQQLRAA